jgi:hypothetical protein
MSIVNTKNINIYLDFWAFSDKIILIDERVNLVDFWWDNLIPPPGYLMPRVRTL